MPQLSQGAAAIAEAGTEGTRLLVSSLDFEIEELQKEIRERQQRVRELQRQRTEALEVLRFEKERRRNEEDAERWTQTFPWTARVGEVAWEYFGVKEFRGPQEKAINVIMTGIQTQRERLRKRRKRQTGETSKVKERHNKSLSGDDDAVSETVREKGGGGWEVECEDDEDEETLDCFLVMPTGGGKSLCFQVPSLCWPDPGLTLVISPLLSLMNDQVMQLKALGVSAEMLSSSCSKEKLAEIRTLLKDLQTKDMDSQENHGESGERDTKRAKHSGEQRQTSSSSSSFPPNFSNRRLPTSSSLQFLYVTPERVAKSKSFLSSVEKVYHAGKLRSIAIDEAHCVSQWGHSFRQDYLHLSVLKTLFPDVPLLLLTATATTRVRDEVKRALNVKSWVHFQSGINRPNLFYQVLPKPRSGEGVLSLLMQIIRSCPSRSPGIVYCLSRKEAVLLSASLVEKGVSAEAFHGEMEETERREIHRRWVSGETQVVVATAAFGMGVHKEDVRFVIHHSVPKSPENFYQESGRAGRDGKKAACVVLFRAADVQRQSVMNFWEPSGPPLLYKMAAMCYDGGGCRHKFLCEHFGEGCGLNNPVVSCDRSCDVCLDSSRREREEVLLERALNLDACREAVGNLLTLLKEAEQREEKVTLLQLGDRWRVRLGKLKPPLKSFASKLSSSSSSKNLVAGRAKANSRKDGENESGEKDDKSKKAKRKVPKQDRRGQNTDEPDEVEHEIQGDEEDEKFEAELERRLRVDAELLQAFAVRLLLAGILKETFAHSLYSTNAYLSVDRRGQTLRSRLEGTACAETRKKILEENLEKRLFLDAVTVGISDRGEVDEKEDDFGERGRDCKTTRLISRWFSTMGPSPSSSASSSSSATSLTNENFRKEQRENEDREGEEEGESCSLKIRQPVLKKTFALEEAAGEAKEKQQRGDVRGSFIQLERSLTEWRRLKAEQIGVYPNLVLTDSQISNLSEALSARMSSSSISSSSASAQFRTELRQGPEGDEAAVVSLQGVTGLCGRKVRLFGRQIAVCVHQSLCGTETETGGLFSSFSASSGPSSFVDEGGLPLLLDVSVKTRNGERADGYGESDCMVGGSNPSANPFEGRLKTEIGLASSTIVTAAPPVSSSSSSSSSSSVVSVYPEGRNKGKKRGLQSFQGAEEKGKSSDKQCHELAMRIQEISPSFGSAAVAKSNGSAHSLPVVGSQHEEVIVLDSEEDDTY